MNPPALTTQIIGRPRVALVLYLGVGFTLFEWIHGVVPWWLGILALCFGGTVRSAVHQLRHYNAWVSDWHAMDGADAPAGVNAKPRASRGALAVQAIGFALLAGVVWNIIPAGQNPFPVYIGLFCLMVGGCIWKTCRLLVTVRSKPARSKAPVKAGAATAATDFVEWTLPPASSSPSRAEITRSLPNYAAQLLTTGSAAPSVSAAGKRPW